MNTEAFSKEQIDKTSEKEVEALVADKQTQDFPQDLQTNGIKSTPITPAFVAVGEDTNSSSPLEPAASSPIDIICLADEMADLIKRHCVLANHEVDAIVLWLISSHQINSFRIFPKLAFISPEKRCGKTTAMEVIHSLSNQGVMASNITGASLYRITEQLQPTLFIDEADTFLKNGDPQLVGLINSSHTKAGAQVIRCVGENFQAKPFSTWMPMVLASIGELPATIMDRSIAVNLRRKKTHEHTDPIPVDLIDLHERIREQIQNWCKIHEPTIRASLIRPPDVGNDRAADNWGPLFTAAKAIGGIWTDRCEQAYRHLTTTVELELPTQLLLDIRTLLQDYGETRISSATLADELCKDSTGPWPTSSNGRPLSQHQLAKLLGPYGIKPKNIRYGDTTLRSYEKNQFTDAFERYLP